MTSVLKRKERLEAKTYGNIKRMGKRRLRRRKRRAGGRRRGENIMVLSGWAQKAEYQVGICVGRWYMKEYSCGPTGPEWDMCPRISKTRVASSRLRSWEKKESKFVISFPPQQRPHL